MVPCDTEVEVVATEDGSNLDEAAQHVQTSFKLGTSMNRWTLVQSTHLTLTNATIEMIVPTEDINHVDHL